MTAHRPRNTGPLEESTLIEVLFFGAAAPRSGSKAGLTHTWRPPTDVYETEGEYVVQAEIAGVQPENFRVALHDHLLTVTGVRYDPYPENRAYHQMEVHFGEFRIDIELPGLVDKDQIDAEYQHGLLRVVLPKLRP